MMSWYGLTWNMRKVDYKRVGMRLICMISITGLVEYVWYVFRT